MIITSESKPTFEFPDSSFFLVDPTTDVPVPRTIVRVETHDTEYEGASSSSINRRADGTPSELLAIADRARRDAERYPDVWRLWLAYAIALLNAGELDDALSAARHASSLARQEREPAILACRVLLARGDVDGARTGLERLLRGHPKDRDVLLLLSEVSVASDQFVEAREYLRMIDVFDTDYVVDYRLGIVQLALGDAASAIHLLRRAAAARPGIAIVHQAMGVAYAVAGIITKALRQFEVALDLDPFVPDGVRALALILERDKRSEVVVGLLQRAIGRDEYNPDLRELLAQALYERGRFAEARRELEYLIRLAGTFGLAPTKLAQLRNNSGVCSASLGDTSKARASFLGAIEGAGGPDPAPSNNLAMIELQGGHPKRAEEAASALQHAGKGTELTAVLLSRAYRDQGQVEAAIRVLQDAAGAGLGSPPVYTDLAVLVADYKDDPALAVQYVLKGLELAPENRMLLNNLAYSLLLMDDVSGARGVLERVGRGQDTRDRESAILTATWGLLLIREGSTKQGQHLYEVASDKAVALRHFSLASRIRIKMHLELARWHAGRGDVIVASRHVRAGLREGGSDIYIDHLLRLAARLGLDLAEMRVDAQERSPKRRRV